MVVGGEAGVVHGVQVVVCLVVVCRSANFERHRVPCSSRSRTEGFERHFVATARTLLVHCIVKDRLREGLEHDRDELEG